MKTIVYKENIGDCDSIIRSGGLVAVPTETVYGLAANGLNEKAVLDIYEVKNRPEVKPLSLMVSSVKDIYKYCFDVPSFAFHFLEHNWPGPFTAIFKAKDIVPSIVLAGGTTVGMRCPDSSLTLELIEKAGVPLAAPSANPSGYASPKNADIVLSYFDGVIDAVIDGGECTLGTESCIIDFSEENIKILRKGFLQLSIIGITGQSGAGKTSVLNYLGEKGFGIIDCDELYHNLLITNKYINQELFEIFPDAYINNELDRKLLSHIVFSNSELLERLNSITHGYIICAIFDKLVEFKNQGINRVAIDAVELISSGIGNMCDTVIGVVSDSDIRIKRIMSRDNITLDEAIMRVNSQKNQNYYINNCDIIIENNGSEKELLNNLEKEINFG